MRDEGKTLLLLLPLHSFCSSSLFLPHSPRHCSLSLSHSALYSHLSTSLLLQSESAGRTRESDGGRSVALSKVKERARDRKARANK